MAEVNDRDNKFKVMPKTGGKRTVTAEEAALPTERRKSSAVLNRYAFGLYGARGIGKSTLANEIAEGMGYFAMFETDRTLDVYADDMRDWPQFCAKVDTFLKGGHKHPCFIVDNGALAYDAAMEYACELYGFDHPGGRDDYGAAWAKVRKEFFAPFRKLLASRYGLIVICHSQNREVVTRGGRKYVEICPDWSGQADKLLGAMMENLWYYHYRNGHERWLQLEGDELVVAKVKLKHNFFTPKGERVCLVPMGDKGEKEAYKRLIHAFENRQTEAYRPGLVGREGMEENSDRAVDVSRFKK